MQTGVLTIDILTLNETNILQDSMGSSPDERAIQLVGRETSCEVSAIDTLKNNLMSLLDRVVPVQFQYKSSYNGYYRVTDVSVDYEKWWQGSTLIAWSLGLSYIGPDNAVDVESRLATITRANDFSLVGERWHAPAIGHNSYYIGALSPVTMTRTTENGLITIYRSIPVGVYPRWGAPVASFTSGRTRFLSNGEHVGSRQLVPTTGWELTNDLVRVRPATTADTTLLVAFYDGTAWRERAWDVRMTAAGSSLVPGTHFTGVTVMRRTHEFTAIRIVGVSPIDNTRVLIDLSLHRGARFLEGQVQRTTSGDIAITQDITDTVTDNTSYVVSSAADANGLKMVIGSARNFDLNANGGITRLATTFIDFFVGATIGTPVSGDAATDLLNQYIGVMPETTEVVRR